MAGAKRLEPADFWADRRRSNPLNYAPVVLPLPSVPSCSFTLRFVPSNTRNCRDSAAVRGNSL
jgi:hypothetical protein